MSLPDVRIVYMRSRFPLRFDMPSKPLLVVVAIFVAVFVVKN